MKSYLVLGKERLLKKEFIAELQKKFFPNTSDISLNFQEYSAQESDLRPVFDFLSTAPFLGSSRMGVLWDIDELEKEDQKRLPELIKSLPETAILVLVSEESNLKKSTFLQEMEKLCTLNICHSPFDRDLPGWIEQRAKKQGMSIEREASRALIERVGKEIAGLQNALEMLSVYVHPRKDIAAADVLALLGKTASEDAFLLVDEILLSNRQAALTRLRGLFREGVRAPEIIGVIGSQFERMKTAAGLKEQGMAPAEIAAFLRIHSFFQDKFVVQLRRVTMDGIVRMQKKLLECDALVKRGRLEEKLALEKLILEA